MTSDSPVRVLLTAPDPGDAEALAALVFAAGAVVAGRAAGPEEARALLPGVEAGLVLGSGVDAAALAQAFRAPGARRPVLALVGGEDGAEEAAMRAGAADALPRAGLTAQALGRALRHVCREARAHAELREARRTLSTLFGNLPGMVYRCRFDGVRTMEFVSHRSVELTGYRAEQLTGGEVAYASLIDPADRERVWSEVQAAVEGARAYRVTYRIRTAAEREKWVCDEGAVVPTEGGGPAVLEGFVSDVTEQVRAEAALRESERWHRTLLEHAEDAIAVLAEDGTVRFATPSLARILGVEPGAVTGTRLRTFVPPQHVDAMLEFRAALLASPGQVLVARVPFATAGGQVRTVEVAGRSLLHDPAVRGLVLNARDVTDREEAERRLAESEQRFKSLFEYNPDAVFSLDARGRFTSFNPAAERLTGISAAALLGHSYAPLVHPGDRGLVAERLARALAGEPQDYEFRLAPRGGETATLHVVKLPVVVDGAIVGVYGIAHDVTQRQRAERLLRLRDRAIAAVEEGIIITDPHQPDNPVVSVNPAFERLTGYPAAEALGRNCRFLQGPGSDPVAIAEMHAAVVDGVSCSVEILNYRRNGQPFWNYVSVAPVRDETGRVTNFIGVMNDVTERRETEEALRSREARFRSMIENAQDIITVLEGDGTVRFASPAVERVLGHSREELEGLDLFDLVHPDDVEAAHRAVGDAIYRPGTPVWVELRLRDRAGAWRVLETVGTSLLHNPSVMGIVLNARDVTDRRNAEKALAESRMQFLQAQKMEAVGRLAGGVAHDFNNLLTAIRGNADLLLLDLAEGDPAREDVLEIRRASDRAAELTRQLLAFSRRQVLQPRLLSLNDVVREMERMLRRLVPAEVELEARLEPHLGNTVADAGQLEQVVMNLVVNARDAMPGGGRVTVETADVVLDEELARRFPYVVPGPYVMLRVADTGHGMDPETRESAFEPFFTTKAPGKGTGLGLSTVYGIVKQSGGYVWIDSEPGQGTRVTIHLPRAGEDEGAQPAARADAEHAAPAMGETVLVVEDEVSVRNLAGRMLSRAGYRVREANDGFEALRMGEDASAPLDLLLTDLAMPRMGGRELARRMRQVRPDVCVLYFSGNAAELEEADPAAAFVEKPFTAQALLAAVRALLDQRANGSRGHDV